MKIPRILDYKFDLESMIDMGEKIGSIINSDFEFGRERDPRGFLSPGIGTEEKSKFLGWETSFTSPFRHDEAKFTYLIHSISTGIRNSTQMVALLKEPESYDRTQSIDLSREPHRISEKKIISTSVINQDKTTTFCDGGGLILKAPLENILVSASEDIATNFFNPTETREKLMRDRRIHISPQEVLDLTSPNEYNEVVLTGETNAGKVETIGIYVKVYEDGELVDPEFANQLHNLSYQFNLPIVQIVKKIPNLKDCIPYLLTENKGIETIAFNFGGNRYLVGNNTEEPKFSRYDKKMTYTPMSRNDFELAREKYQELSPEEKERFGDFSAMDQAFNEFRRVQDEKDALKLEKVPQLRSYRKNFFYDVPEIDKMLYKGLNLDLSGSEFDKYRMG